MTVCQCCNVNSDDIYEMKYGCSHLINLCENCVGKFNETSHCKQCSVLSCGFCKESISVTSKFLKLNQSC